MEDRLGSPVLFTRMATPVAHLAGMLRVHLGQEGALAGEPQDQLAPVAAEYHQVESGLGLYLLTRCLCRALGRLRHALGIQVRYHEGIRLIGQCQANVMRFVGAVVLLLALQLCLLAPIRLCRRDPRCLRACSRCDRRTLVSSRD